MPENSRSESDQEYKGGRVRIKVKLRPWTPEVVKEFGSWKEAQEWMRGQRTQKQTKGDNKDG